MKLWIIVANRGSLINPLKTIRISTTSTMFDTIIETGSGDEPSTLTVFGRSEMSTIFTESMVTIIKITHILSIIALIGISAFAWSENPRVLIWNKRLVILFKCSFVNPLNVIWVLTIIAMLDTVIKSTWSNEAGSLTSFRWNEMSAIFTKTEFLIVKVAHVSTIITLHRIIAFARSKNIGSWSRRCCNWFCSRFVNPFKAKEIDSACTYANTCIESSFR